MNSYAKVVWCEEKIRSFEKMQDPKGIIPKLKGIILLFFYEFHKLTAAIRVYRLQKINSGS